MIWVGLDDTDTLDTPGTNQLARHIAETLRDELRCRRILRHQLLEDPRVPCTRKNGCASIELETLKPIDIEQLAARLEGLILEWIPEGSDPGLCVVPLPPAPQEVAEWGQRAKCELLTQAEAYDIAARHGLRLKGLAGTRDGVIGALAAVGLMTAGNDGRVVYLSAQGADLLDASGRLTVEAILARGVDEVRELTSGVAIITGMVSVTKKLRPNWRDGRAVLYVSCAATGEYVAEKVV
jgi:hypothetical protein